MATWGLELLKGPMWLLKGSCGYLGAGATEGPNVATKGSNVATIEALVATKGLLVATWRLQPHSHPKSPTDTNGPPTATP